MLVRFYASEGKEREEDLATALKDDAAQFDDKVEIATTASFDAADPSVDVACAFGVKGHTKEILDGYRALGKRTVMFDKALIRPPGAPTGYHRVCVDGTTPLAYMMRKMRTWERWDRLGIRVKPRQEPRDDTAIVFAGSSEKYCAMHGLGGATDYATRIFEALRTIQKRRPLVYRPKPSWTGFVPIAGTRLSRGETLDSLLPEAHVVVTHGSSAAVDAIVAGVPAVALGDCAATPVAGRRLEDVRNPPFPSEEVRMHFLWQLAFCQWRVSELRTGEAWAFIRHELEATA